MDQILNAFCGRLPVERFATRTGGAGSLASVRQLQIVFGIAEIALSEASLAAYLVYRAPCANLPRFWPQFVKSRSLG